MTNALETLKNHESDTPSRFVERAGWRRENSTWLAWSRGVALSLIRYMEDENINRNALAERLGVSPQYVSKVLSGKVNFSFKSIAEIEQKLNLHLLEVTPQ